MLRITKTIPVNVPASSVYHACTTKEGIQGWWALDCEIGRGRGAEHELRFFKQGNNSVTMKFRIEEVKPEEKIVWLCTENTNPIWINTKLIFSIQAKANGSVLELEHIGFEDKHENTPPFKASQTGWEHFAKSFKTYLETGKGEPWA